MMFPRTAVCIVCKKRNFRENMRRFRWGNDWSEKTRAAWACRECFGEWWGDPDRHCRCPNCGRPSGPAVRTSWLTDWCKWAYRPDTRTSADVEEVDG